MSFTMISWYATYSVATNQPNPTSDESGTIIARIRHPFCHFSSFFDLFRHHIRYHPRSRLTFSFEGIEKVCVRAKRNT